MKYQHLQDFNIVQKSLSKLSTGSSNVLLKTYIFNCAFNLYFIEISMYHVSLIP